nr:HNH endonuclease [Staphylococcus warneri]
MDINSFDNYYTDFKKADKLAEREKRIENTWHHHEDGKTMQEVNKKIHR